MSSIQLAVLVARLEHTLESARYRMKKSDAVDQVAARNAIREAQELARKIREAL